MERPNDAPADGLHHALRARAFADERDEERRVGVVVRRRRVGVVGGPLPVRVEEQHPFVPADREAVARDGLAVADALEQRVPADDVLVLACVMRGAWRSETGG